MKRIAVLMTCYNRCETTLSCLRTLFAQNGLEDIRLDVWLVDDASPDKTGARVKAAYPQVNVVYSKGNLFWCKGMRLAWDSAVSSGIVYDFYLWLNDDVSLKGDAVWTMVHDYEVVGDKTAVIVGAFSADEIEADVSYSAVSAGMDRIRPSGSPVLVRGFLNGNFVLVSRETYEIVGPICGLYSHGKGDYDYGCQLNKRGLNFYVSSKFMGICPRQPDRYLHLSGLGLMERLALLVSPKGYNLKDTIVFRWRNNGIIPMMVSAVHVIWIVVRGKDIWEK